MPLDHPRRLVRRVQPIAGYILAGGLRIYCDKKFYTNRLKGVLYKEKGTSILKELTEVGERAEKIFWNLEILRNDREKHPERNEGSLASVYAAKKTSKSSSPRSRTYSTRKIIFCIMVHFLAHPTAS